MEQKNEAVYLLNGETYLHLQENGAGVGFATYNKVTGEPLESGQILRKEPAAGWTKCDPRRPELVSLCTVRSSPQGHPGRKPSYA